MYRNQHVTVLIPALDEEDSIGKVIADLQLLKDVSNQSIIDHIIVCDNGSTDDTSDVAKKAGATVVFEPKRGYGYACLCAINTIDQTDIVMFIDADHAFFAQEALKLLGAVSNGADMVIGSRTLGYAAPQALTPVQRFGNMVATTAIRHIWKHHYSDLGPFRAIRYNALQRIMMQDTHYGWTVEMQVKAILYGLTIKEVPVDTRVRIGTSKISGTIRGSVKAGIGILGMIAKLYWQSFDIKKTQHRIQQNQII